MQLQKILIHNYVKLNGKLTLWASVGAGELPSVMVAKTALSLLAISPDTVVHTEPRDSAIFSTT